MRPSVAELAGTLPPASSVFAKLPGQPGPSRGGVPRHLFESGHKMRRKRAEPTDEYSCRLLVSIRNVLIWVAALLALLVVIGCAGLGHLQTLTFHH